MVLVRAEELIRTSAERRGWKVNGQLAALAGGPDLVLTNSDGTALVIEAKTAGSRYGQLTQLAKDMDALHAVTGGRVRCLLITNESEPPTYAQAAEEIGVHLLHFEQEPNEVDTSVAQYLDEGLTDLGFGLE